MKEYNILIKIGEVKKEVLLIHPEIHPEEACIYGIERIKEDKFWDGVREKWYDLEKVLINHNGSLRELKKRVIGEEKSYKIISGSIERIKNQINEIITIMEII
jgi:hypothetical protein